jgi:opacity protein-like surface antigen
MYKKIILASAILAASVGVAAASAPAPYVGASLGLTNNSLTVNENTTIGTFRGVPFNVFVGYGGVLTSNFYLAGELNGTVATANISDNTALKSSYGLGLSVLPGFMLNDSTLAYARVGVVRSHFTAPNDNRDGAQFGLGLQTSVTQNIDIRGEYDFVAYQSEKEMGVSVAPRSDQFSVGIVYKIG